MALDQYLPLYDAMRKAIKDCHSTDEIDNLIKDDMEALRMYTAQLEDKITRHLFNEIYLRATRRRGEIEIQIRSEQKLSDTACPKVTEAERKRISTAIRIAKIPEKEFEIEVTKPGVSKTKLLVVARQIPKPEPEYANRIDKETLEKIEHRQKLTKIAKSINEIRKGLKRAVDGFSVMKSTIETIGNYTEKEFTDGMYNDLQYIAKALRILDDLLKVNDTRDIPMLRR